MANEVWKGGLPLVFWALRLHKFFDPSTLSMKKGPDGGKRRKKTGEKKEKTGDYIGHYVIASSRPPEPRLNVA